MKRDSIHTIMKILFFALLHAFALAAFSQQPEIGGYYVYYGSLHDHSSVSDGEGSATDAYSAARDAAHYDFFALTDHGELLSNNEWNTVKQIANYFNEDGVFVALWGFEWSSPLYGHAVVIGSGSYCSAILGGVGSFTEFVQWVNARDCLAFFAHPGYTDANGTEFDHFHGVPSYKFVGMELWNGRDGFSTYYDNNGYFSGDDGLSYYDEALIRGWRIGAMGNEDNHNANWGVIESAMAVLAPELTREAIWDALMKRRVYSTLDQNLEMSFKIQGQEMGSVLHPGSYQGEIRLHDAGEEVFTKVELICNGRICQSFAIEEVSPLIHFDTETRSGDYIYIRVYQQDGDRAISSPIYFDDATSSPELLEENRQDIQLYYANGRSYIQIVGIISPVMLTMTDYSGHICYRTIMEPNEILEFSATSLSSGIYLLYVEGHPELQVRKLVIR